MKQFRKQYGKTMGQTVPCSLSTIVKGDYTADKIRCTVADIPNIHNSLFTYLGIIFVIRHF